MYDAIRLTELQRSRMYGLLKTYKGGTPPSSMQCMTGSSHQKLAGWLAGLLQSVLERF